MAKKKKKLPKTSYFIIRGIHFYAYKCYYRYDNWSFGR